MQTGDVGKLTLDLACARKGFGTDWYTGQAVEFVGERVVV